MVFSRLAFPIVVAGMSVWVGAGLVPEFDLAPKCEHSGYERHSLRSNNAVWEDKLRILFIPELVRSRWTGLVLRRRHKRFGNFATNTSKIWEVCAATIEALYYVHTKDCTYMRAFLAM